MLSFGLRISPFKEDSQINLKHHAQLFLINKSILQEVHAEIYSGGQVTQVQRFKLIVTTKKYKLWQSATTNCSQAVMMAQS